MADETQKTEDQQNTAPTQPEKTQEAPKQTEEKGSVRARGGKRGKRNERPQRERSEFEQRIVEIRRVTRVMAGGRRFSFSVSMVIGDQKGRVGVGLGKAGDTALAIEKAVRDARKNLITIKRTEENSIPHEVEAKYASSHVALYPAPGRGLVAGSAVRTVLELGGVDDVAAKILTRSKNKLTISRATVEALEKLK